jgi:hypothetical protein
LASLGVEFQLWIAKKRAQQVYKAFRAPTVDDEAKEPLAEQWKKIIAYAGVGAMLPPWVTGLLIPAVTLVTATAALASAYADLAADQKRAAGVADPPTSTSPTAAPEGARAAA